MQKQREQSTTKVVHSCRICGRKFRAEPVWERIVLHIESKHPSQLLPYREEFAYLAQQRECQECPTRT
jgi:hypothetical protein